ncbi:hypothetical protein B0O99DRAFT_352155 [Bisporella sp. PMI_857]|nr:hypothetical protein B0O99DRAFT_352155 [Bisporella sp. PMI_857]
MTAPRILFTGATGYLGGDALIALMQEFPHWERTCTCLVRNKERGALLTALYPQVRQVYCDLSGSAVLEREAAAADIVIHCASIEDTNSSKALARGLAKRTRNGPAFWICLSGTDNLGWRTIEQHNYGEAADKVYDDFDGIAEVIALPDTAPHRDVEKIQLESGSDNIKVAIVCAPCVYGLGRGCGNTRSIQIPDLAKYTIEKGKAFIVGKGLNQWPNIHVQDLSSIIVSLVKEAAEGGGAATWNEQGYYFAENGEHVWRDIVEQVAEEAKSQGLVHNSDIVSLSAEEADKQIPFAGLFYGTDSRCNGIRARKVLGWKPVGYSIEQEICRAVKEEAVRLQM